MNWLRTTSIGLAGVAAALALGAATPAKADWGYYGYQRPWYGPRYGYVAPRYYNPPVVYAAPPTYYAPPPPVYYGPYASPGVTFGFSIR